MRHSRDGDRADVLCSPLSHLVCATKGNDITSIIGCTLSVAIRATRSRKKNERINRCRTRRSLPFERRNKMAWGALIYGRLMVASACGRVTIYERLQNNNSPPWAYVNGSFCHASLSNCPPRSYISLARHYLYFYWIVRNCFFFRPP